MDLHTAGHRRGVVAAPHAAAVEAGRAVLAEGGNALEAMVAMAASIAAVYPHMNHIGGDGFWVIAEPGGRVHSVHGCGAAAEAAKLSLYAGLDAVPRGLLDAGADLAQRTRQRQRVAGQLGARLVGLVLA